MNGGANIRRLAALLSDPARSEHPCAFPADSIAADNPGLYSWWADAEAQNLFHRAGGNPSGQFLYVGQAGATIWPSGRKSDATLKSRIRSNHIRGTISSSTFRRTLSALLRQSLNLHLEAPGRLAREDNRRVSRWIEDHLRITIVQWQNRDSLQSVEKTVLDILDPPFNLHGRPPTDLRRHLAELRRALKE